MTTNGTRKMEAIETEIQQTRSRVDEAIDAIQNKLSPSRLAEQTLDYLRHSGAADLASNLGMMARRNPLSITLFGVGMAWLMVSGSRHNAAAQGRNHDDVSDYGYDLDPEVYRPRENFYNESLIMKSPPQRGNSRSNPGIAQDTVSGMSYRFDQSKNQFLDLVEEQPWLFGALGLAIGAAIAAALPATRHEDEWMGKASDKLADKMTGLGQEQFEKGKSVLHSAQDVR